MLAKLIAAIIKAATKTQAKSAGSNARNLVRNNPKITGTKEAAAIKKINDAVDKVMTKIDKDAAAVKKAPAPGVAASRAAERNRQENIRTSESKSSINKSRNVSKTDIRAANTAAQFRTMQNRIDSMDAGNSKTMMQNLLDRQKAMFKKEQGAELSAMQRKQQQSARDKKMKGKVTLPKTPFKKGGLAKGRKKK